MVTHKMKDGRPVRFLTTGQAHRLRAEGYTMKELREGREVLLAPISGGSPEGDDDDDDEPAGGGSGDDDDDDDDDDDEPAGSGDGDDDDDDIVRVPRSEWERVRRERKEAEKARKKDEKERRERDEQQKREQGRYKELAEDREKERDEAIRERDEARAELQKHIRSGRVTKIANRLNFNDPSDAVRYLDDDEVMDDDDRTERALKRVLETKPWLKDKRPRTGLPGGGGGGGPKGPNGQPLTMEDVENMSEAEINANWDAVQEVMRRSGAAA